MPVLNLPAMIQVNWTGSNVWGMWEQANANILSPGLQEVEFTRELAIVGVQADTCRIVSTDPTWAVVQARAASPLYPYVRAGRLGPRIRVLEQTAMGSGVWTARFVGAISEITPTPTDEVPATVTILAESPLRQLAPVVVTLSALTAGATVADALRVLLTAVHLNGTDYVTLETFWRQAVLPADWGGGEASFGQALTELLRLAGAVAAVVPQYAVNDTTTDWTLRIWQPTQTATTTWVAEPGGDLFGGSSVVYGDELP